MVGNVSELEPYDDGNEQVNDPLNGLVIDPFKIPDQFDDDDTSRRPRWWYAAQLRVAGASWRDIAHALGYENEGRAQQAVSRNKKTRAKDQLEDIVDLELERLDLMQLVAWTSARRGDQKAMQTILGIMNMRMKLLGTEKKADESKHVTNNTAIIIGGTEDDYVEALSRAREAAKGRVIDA